MPQPPEPSGVEKLGGVWTIVTLLYISPFTAEEIRALSVRDVCAYTLRAYTLTRHGGHLVELQRSQLGLALVVRQRYSILEHTRYTLALARAVAASAVITWGPETHPVELAPDACWPN